MRDFDYENDHRNYFDLEYPLPWTYPELSLSKMLLTNMASHVTKDIYIFQFVQNCIDLITN